VQCDTEFADFNFRVRFHFDGRSNDFAARVGPVSTKLAPGAFPRRSLH
jgi:hypothetical protein